MKKLPLAYKPFAPFAKLPFWQYRRGVIRRLPGAAAVLFTDEPREWWHDILREPGN